MGPRGPPGPSGKPGDDVSVSRLQKTVNIYLESNNSDKATH